jgi:hypothetical protein
LLACGPRGPLAREAPLGVADGCHAEWSGSRNNVKNSSILSAIQ